MEKQTKQTRTSSRRRLQEINEEQKNLSRQFKISNFYRQEKLDLQALKRKIKQVKLRQSDSKQKQIKSISYQQAKVDLVEQPPRRYLKTRDRTQIPKFQSISRARNQPLSQNSFYNLNPETKPQSGLDYYQSLKQRNQPSQLSKIRKQKQQNNDKKIAIIRAKQKQKQHQKEHQRTKLEPIVHLNTVPDQKIVIQDSIELSKYQNRVQQLWSLYELLTRIMQGVQKYPFKQQLSIIKYVEDVCSQKFEFIKDLLENVINKRFHRCIIQSRLLENIAIVYLSIQLCQKKRIRNSYLVNFLGFCSSNVVFLIRMINLCHDLTIQPSSNVIRIIDAIKTFQMDSYKCEISAMKQLVLRMQHNNQIINILQARLGNNNTKEYQLAISQFLKHTNNKQTLYEYSHYIFQFLAYYLNKQKMVGLLPYLQIAPAPYLSLLYPQSVIIQPWGVLFFQKGSKLYIRAHTETFINQISKYCNIIFWTDLMPSEADPLLAMLPSADNIHYLYKYHCKYEKSHYIKIVWRTGCLPENAIIIDRDYQNFPYDRDMGIQLSWKGQKKDKKLLSLLQILVPRLIQGKTLKKPMEQVRAAIKQFPVKRNRTLQKRNARIKSKASNQMSNSSKVSRQFRHE